MTGEFHHSLDSKGRVNFPAKLREELGHRFYVTKGLDGCLFVYSQAEWERLAQRIRSQPAPKARNLQRYFYGSAVEAEPDKQGRIVIPTPLREFAGLEKDVVIIGSMDWAEIWDAQKWSEQKAIFDDDEFIKDINSMEY